jgi:UDP-glucose 4-epimerase
MRVLLTGASSFTGYWFARELRQAGHEVVATFRGDADSYVGIRATRVLSLTADVECAWQVSFGSERFLELLSTRRWDVVCHHAAEMTNYRSWDFDALAATRANTANCRAVFETLARAGGSRFVATGSVFEPYEGEGDPQRRAFSPYGLSKHLSYELLRLEAERVGVGLAKFVIPNPFGPFEEPRFTTYLAREWSDGRVPQVKTPDYIRDNIHVSLLARVYRQFCERASQPAGPDRCCPSGYIETQGAFAQRLGSRLGTYLERELPLALATQTSFDEPRIRVNTEPARELVADWSEDRAWNELCEYYDRAFFHTSRV